jgi:hypothetical protein
MTRRTLPDGIEDESRHPPSLERGVWGRRVFVTVLMAIVVLALANVFGQAMTASEASSSQATIRVEAPSALRGGLLYQVVFTVTARTALSNPVLQLSNGWFSGLTMNAEVPQPSGQFSRLGGPAFTLGPMQAGQQRTVRIYFQVNPTTVTWRRSVDAELDDGHTLLVTSHRTMTVYP